MEPLHGPNKCRLKRKRGDINGVQVLKENRADTSKDEKKPDSSPKHIICSECVMAERFWDLLVAEVEISKAARIPQRETDNC